MAADGLDGLIVRCGDLEKLVRCVAYVMRVVGRTHRKNQLEKFGKEIDATEYGDAYSYLIYWEQSQRLSMSEVNKLVPNTIMVKLSNYEVTVPHVIIAGRVKNFPVSFSSDNKIPIIPYGVLAKLIVLFYHDKYHREIDTIVTFVRSDVWVVKARKIASAIDIRCRICLEKRKRLASQQMGSLPSFRSEMLPSFSVTCMDIFGPYEIRDDCVKKVQESTRKFME